MSRYGLMRVSLISFQMMRVISSPSSSTTVPSTLIFDIGATLQGWPARSVSVATGGCPTGVSALRGLQRGVQRLARPHDRHGLLAVRVVVTADIDRIALYLSQFGHNGVFVLGQRLGQ